MSNANSATQAPHTEEDVPIDLSDSGGMQSPQTNVNDDVEFSDSSLDQLPCPADNYTMDLCDVITDSKKVGKIQHEDDWPPFPLLGYFLAKKESEAKIV